MPPRSRLRAQSKKKNAIRSRSGWRVAPQSPFLSRNYEIASLKDPLRASARSILSIFFSLIGVVTHRRPPLSRSSCRRRRFPPLALLFPRRHREIGNALSHPPSWRSTFSLSLFSSLFLSAAIERPSSYSPRVFIPDRFVLLPVATPRDRPRLAQVTAIGNFNARPVLPNDFIQRNGCRGAARRGVASTIDAQTRDRHTILVYFRVIGPPLVVYKPPSTFVRRDLIFLQSWNCIFTAILNLFLNIFI